MALSRFIYTGSVIFKNYQNFQVRNLLSWALISLGAIAVSYVIAALSFKFIEKPVLDRVHKRGGPVKPLSRADRKATA
jgi:peptidoglycan/LPS O-acetylase OafA/YrhL